MVALVYVGVVLVWFVFVSPVIQLATEFTGHGVSWYNFSLEKGNRIFFQHVQFL